MKLTAVKDKMHRAYQLKIKIRALQQRIESRERSDSEVHTGGRGNPRERLQDIKMDYEDERAQIFKELPEIRRRLQIEIDAAPFDETTKTALEIYYVELLNIRETAKRMHYSKSQVYRLIEDGRKKWPK